MSEEWFYLSGKELASRIRARKIRSVDLVEAHIREVERVNPRIHAVVKTRFDEAREEAARADERVRSEAPESLPPLLGVPCTIKESFCLTGMPNTSGLVSRIGTVATEDATTVARLRAAGAIPMGVTNTSELCMWMESTNKVYGRTNNPYDVRRIVGGSSGGEGAIVGSGASPFGLGSDIGGSIRMPAFFNGVFGHKPTGGLVPNTGQYPLAEGPAARYCTTGPLTRRAEDLPFLLSILAGKDGRCEGAAGVDYALRDAHAVDVRKLDVVSIPDNGRIFVSRDLRGAQKRAADYLSSRGCRVRTIRPDRLKYSTEIWAAGLSTAGGKSYAELLGAGTSVDGLTELKRLVSGKSPYTIPSVALVILEEITHKLGDESQKFLQIGAELQAELEREVGDEGVMLYPSHAWPAPLHNVPLVIPFLFVYTAVLNILEFPVTQVPLGLDAKGVPLGVQVGATRGNDHLTMAVALELEKGFGGWVRPVL